MIMVIKSLKTCEKINGKIKTAFKNFSVSRLASLLFLNKPQHGQNNPGCVLFIWSFRKTIIQNPEHCLPF